MHPLPPFQPSAGHFVRKPAAALAALAFGVLSTWSLPSAASVVVTSTLFDCDRSVQTTSGQGGALFGTFGNCNTAPIAGSPPVGTSLANGDFSVFQYQSQPILGDGSNEVTGGTFNFLRDDPANWNLFSGILGQTHGKVVAGTLTLLLDVLGDVSATDTFNIGEVGIGSWIANRPSFPVGNLVRGRNQVVLNLRDFYDVSDLTLRALSGRVPFLYQDDATIVAASLRLTADLPEPGTLALLGLALSAAWFSSMRAQVRRASRPA